MRHKSLFLLVLLLLVTACKPSVPRKYLQPKKMERVIYDLHLAQSLADTDRGGDRALLSHTYREAVLRKHGVTEAELDSSLVYYMRHTERLHDIYVNVAQRLEDEARDLGADVSELNKYAQNKEDTTDIWKGERTVILSPETGFSYYSFQMKADSSFRRGDCLTLKFNSQFLYQDGTRDGVALLSFRYANDSIAHQIVHANASRDYSVRLNDHDSIGIKEVKGFFYVSPGHRKDESKTTLKLWIVQQISLHRDRAGDKKKTTASPAIGVPAAGNGSAEKTDTVGRQDKATAVPQENSRQETFKTAPARERPQGKERPLLPDERQTLPSPPVKKIKEAPAKTRNRRMV